MQENHSITQIEPTNDILDYAFLRQVGIEEIQKLAGNRWTDYNYHDPGITILETLAFALTELGYKSRYPVEDILATNGKHINDTLFPPSEILSTTPVTTTDFHKIVLDIDGIKDVIFYPSKKYPEFTGVYDINIELFPEYDNKRDQDRIKQIVFETVHQNRNLCEDFYEINFIEHEPVTFELDVSVNDRQDLEEIYIEIFENLYEYISPTPKFKTLQDMLDEDFDVDKIYDGPFLKSGFITNEEFERLDERNVISASDIIHFIMDIEGVEMINSLNIIDKEGVKHQWLQSVEKGKAFEINRKDTKINFFKFGKAVSLKEDLSQEITKIEKREDNRLKFKKLTFTKKEGVYRNLSHFDTIQNDFPEIYGIGELGLPVSATNKRKGQAKQLKAYLLFFEQILTNFYAQLANLNNIFSIDTIFNTYYGQPILDAAGVEALYKPFIIECLKKNIEISNSKTLKSEWKKNLDANKQEIEMILRDIIENEETFYDRRHRVLDHLLARVSLNFSDYFYEAEIADSKVIRYKTKILKNYIKISKERSKAQFFLKQKIKNVNKISGLEYRIKSFLNLSGSSDKFPFDFYHNILSVNKTKEKKDDLGYNFAFKNTTKENVIRETFKYGSEIKNYVYRDKKIQLVDDNFNSIAEISNKDLNTEKLDREDLKKVSLKLSAYFGKISKKSEAIFVIERLLYRPHPKMKYFAFRIVDENNNNIYINKEYQQLDQRNEKVKKIIKCGQNRENYDIKTISKQFKIVIQDENKKELVISHRFFEKKEEVEKQIKKQISYFKNIDKGLVPLDDSFKFYTKHYDLYNLLDNPYSFIITILIPDWAARFQNEVFRLHLISVIEKEMPAHILPDIKVVSVDRLVKITSLCNKYQNLISDKNPDFSKLEEISDELFGYFLDAK